MWRERAEWAVKGTSSPTVPIGAPGSDDAVSQRHARAVIDLALRVGEAMLATGASAADVVATVLRLTAAYGVRSTHVDITFTSLTISNHRGLDADPLSVMRVVRVRAPDYTRLQRVQLVVDQVTDPPPGRDPLPVDEARTRLAEALNAPHPYRRWVVMAGQSLIAGGVVALFGAGPVMVLVAALTAAVVHQVSRALTRWGIASFFNQAVSAAIPTLVAVLIHWFGTRGAEIPGVQSPSLVAIAGIIVLLAGLTVMGAAQDALDGYYVTAAARGLEVVVLTLGIAVGVSVVLSMSARLGVPMEVSAFVGPDSAPYVGIPAAALIGVGFAVSTYTGPRATLVAGAVASLVWTTYLLVAPLELQRATTVACGGAVAGAVGYAAHRWLRVPELAVTTAAIVSLLPGLAVFRALQVLMDEGTGQAALALDWMLEAVSIGLGLAAGVSIGGYVARRRFGLDRAADRATRRARGSERD